MTWTRNENLCRIFIFQGGRRGPVVVLIKDGLPGHAVVAQAGQDGPEPEGPLVGVVLEQGQDAVLQVTGKVAAAQFVDMCRAGLFGTFFNFFNNKK